MKTKTSLCLALTLGLGLVGLARADEPPSLTANELRAIAEEGDGPFTARYNTLFAAHDWRTLQRVGRARREAHPDEVLGWAAEFNSAYANGDLDAAIAAGARLHQLTSQSKFNIEPRLSWARAVRRDYPDLQLQPVEWVQSPSTRQIEAVRAQAERLLRDRKYDEIERVARDLQKSKATGVLGESHLLVFFDGLARAGADVSKSQSALAAWRKARPASALARLAAIDFWTRQAWDARGTGYAASITPAMQEKIEAALSRANAGIAELPVAAQQSPLFFLVLQDWAKLAGPGREFTDGIFQQGTAKFPEVYELYSRQARIIMPQWYGAPGEWQELAQTRADQIGGVEGDIFYARLLTKIFPYSNSQTEGEEQYDAERFWRGLAALRARTPDSPLLRSVQLAFGFCGCSVGATNRDYERAKSALTEPNGQQLDASWGFFSRPGQRETFSSNRIDVLASREPK